MPIDPNDADEDFFSEPSPQVPPAAAPNAGPTPPAAAPTPSAASQTPAAPTPPLDLAADTAGTDTPRKSTLVDKALDVGHRTADAAAVPVAWLAAPIGLLAEKTVPTLHAGAQATKFTTALGAFEGGVALAFTPGLYATTFDHIRTLRDPNYDPQSDKSDQSFSFDLQNGSEETRIWSLSQVGTEAMQLPAMTHASATTLSKAGVGVDKAFTNSQHLGNAWNEGKATAIKWGKAAIDGMKTVYEPVIAAVANTAGPLIESPLGKAVAPVIGTVVSNKAVQVGARVVLGAELGTVAIIGTAAVETGRAVSAENAERAGAGSAKTTGAIIGGVIGGILGIPGGPMGIAGGAMAGSLVGSMGAGALYDAGLVGKKANEAKGDQGWFGNAKAAVHKHVIAPVATPFHDGFKSVGNWMVDNHVKDRLEKAAPMVRQDIAHALSSFNKQQGWIKQLDKNHSGSVETNELEGILRARGLMDPIKLAAAAGLKLKQGEIHHFTPREISDALNNTRPATPQMASAKPAPTRSA